MGIELHCPRCRCRFASPADSPAAEVFDRILEEGPWCALGDGETFEDLIHSALTARDVIRCRSCGTPASVSEHSLGRLAKEVLGQW